MLRSNLLLYKRASLVLSYLECLDVTFRPPTLITIHEADLPLCSALLCPALPLRRSQADSLSEFVTGTGITEYLRGKYLNAGGLKNDSFTSSSSSYAARVCTSG